MGKLDSQMIKEIMDYPEKLNDWEHDFIDGIIKRRETTECSEKEHKVICQIYSKVF